MPRAATPPPPFPLYLLPNIPLPFRRRRSSTISTSTASPSSSPPTNPTPSYLTHAPTSHLRCQKCLTDLAPTTSIISKGFTGRHGRAYLVSPPPLSALSSFPGVGEMTDGDLPNTTTGEPAPRQLVTGAHTVSDISCAQCGTVLGWKYVGAEEEAQRYKVGKFILETRRVVKGVGWDGRTEEREWEDDDTRDGTLGLGLGMGLVGRQDDDEVQFDSQDEEECEDLFSGIWSPALARKRRKARGTWAGK